MSTEKGEFPPELRDIATSIAASAKNANPPALENMLALLTESLDARLADTPKTILAGWRERDALLGQTIQWQSGEGVAEGIDKSGALIVQTDSGRVFLDAGEVHLRR